ncbi:MAG TPA: nuclear transport factor 2 family protein [Candidatus Nitrosotalea sp.]|nr:nuclear transport factor 2 family protein [Candidatus Nitrosotalea sp.]
MFLGSTEFYISSESDEFTPSHLQAAPLRDNLSRRSDGTIPEWIVEGSTKSPAEQFVEWFNNIWHTGDPSLWGPSVFTNDAVLIDPSGVSRGANQAASLFLMLFRFFPDLRGEVVSWAANEREIFINWRFSIVQSGSKKPLLVTVVDKFCFVDGRVSFRLAYYDIITFAGYLAETSGQDQLFDFLTENMRQAQMTGGLQLIPRMLANFVKGLFVWAPHPRSLGLKAESGDGFVKLEWKPFPKAVSYRIWRATSLDGPYEVPGDEPPMRVEGTSYIDTTVTNGTAYWYFVSPNFHEELRATPVKRRTLHPSTHPIAFARPKFFGSRRPVH